MQRPQYEKDTEGSLVSDLAPRVTGLSRRFLEIRPIWRWTIPSGLRAISDLLASRE